MKTAIVLFNLGGPDSPEAVKPFLFNLFHDPAIIGLPQPLRWLVARLVSSRRAPVAREIYGLIGGKSPILEKTREQATALDALLNRDGASYKSFIAMRYWHPFAAETAAEIRAWGAQRVILLPLYPQFSTTTTGSSLRDWKSAAARAGLAVPTVEIGCYFDEPHFVEAHAETVRTALVGLNPDDTRILFSAHGLPEKIVAAGDPYQWQVEQSVAAIMASQGDGAPEHSICYQSRVGPLKWIGPSTEEEIHRAGRDGKAVVLVPVAFVSEHSETLVELDIEYGKLARESGVSAYHRVPALGDQPRFIEGLAELVRAASAGGPGMMAKAGAQCPAPFGRCICRGT